MLVDQGKDDEAEPLHRRALSMREELHGAKHPEVATSLEFLARMAIKQGASLVHPSRVCGQRYVIYSGCGSAWDYICWQSFRVCLLSG